MRNRYLGNYKKENFLRILTGNAKNEMLGPSGPPMHLLRFHLKKFKKKVYFRSQELERLSVCIVQVCFIYIVLNNVV